MRAAGAARAAGLAFCAALSASAQTASPQETLEFFKDEALNMRVYTASRHAEPIDETAANVTVVTEAEIRERGAATLAEVLELLPGVQVTTHRKGSQKIWVRGVTSSYNDKTLLLIDGFPFKEVVYGQHPLDEEVPLTDVKRIELIKGPGSAMYGANAMSGVINVITKDPVDVRDVEAKAGFGSWDRQSHSALIARQGAETGALVSGTYFDTIGSPHDKDEGGNATARRHPKRLHASSMKLTHGEFMFSGRFQDFRTQHVSAPDTKTTTFRDRTALIGLLWRHAYGDRLSLTARAFHNLFDWPQDKESYQAGTGALSKIEKRTERTQVTGGGLQAEYSAPGGHAVIGGLDIEFQEGREIEEVTFKTNVANPTPSVTRFADPASPTETQWAVFLQDSWRFLPDWRAVAGLRYDRPKTLKGQLSPRGALIYTPDPSFLAKLLYGRAYRAPSFREYYIREPTSTDGDNGNPALRAETIETVELLFQWRPARGWRAGVSLYNNTVRDFIAPDPAGIGRYNNMGSQSIGGVEPELSYAFEGGRAFANFTLLRTRDRGGDDIRDVAKEMFNVGGSFLLRRRLNVAATLHHVGRRNRPADYQGGVAAANRGDRLGAYDRVNLTLTTRELPLELMAGVYNLFDTRSFNPSYFRPEFDIEHPRRSYRVEARFRFR